MHNWIDIRREIAWLGSESIYFVNDSAEQALLQNLSRLGFSIVVIDGEHVTNEESFFSAISSALMFPEYFGRNWDAFADCFGELAFRPEKRLAILWIKASISLKINPYVFVKATHELLNAAADVGRCDSPEDQRAQVEVFFLGTAPDFTKGQK